MASTDGAEVSKGVLWSARPFHDPSMLAGHNLPYNRRPGKASGGQCCRPSGVNGCSSGSTWHCYHHRPFPSASARIASSQRRSASSCVIPSGNPLRKTNVAPFLARRTNATGEAPADPCAHVAPVAGREPAGGLSPSRPCCSQESPGSASFIAVDSETDRSGRSPGAAPCQRVMLVDGRRAPVQSA